MAAHLERSNALRPPAAGSNGGRCGIAATPTVQQHTRHRVLQSSGLGGRLGVLGTSAARWPTPSLGFPEPPRARPGAATPLLPTQASPKLGPISARCEAPPVPSTGREFCAPARRWSGGCRWAIPRVAGAPGPLTADPTPTPGWLTPTLQRRPFLITGYIVIASREAWCSLARFEPSEYAHRVGLEQALPRSADGGTRSCFPGALGPSPRLPATIPPPPFCPRGAFAGRRLPDDAFSPFFLQQC